VSSYGQAVAVGQTGSNVQVDNNYIARLGTFGPVSGFSETHGINGGDPRFVNAPTNDFHLLAGSPAIGRGVTPPGFTTDFDGNIRSIPWDIGAFAFGSSPEPSSPPPAPTNLRLSQ
jgi:hypothetical protein